MDVERPKDALLDDLDAKPQRFELDELHDHLRKALNQLEMEGLVIEDHLYVDARKTLPKGFWDYRERRLQTWVDSDVVRSYMRRPSETIRHFRAVRVISWSGQLVVTVFLHVTRTGPLLYIRTRYHCLTPLKPRFEQADSVPPVPILPDVLRQAAAALGELIEGAVHPSRWFRPGLAIRHLRRRAFPPREDGRLTGLRERLGWYRIYWRRTSIRARASDHGVRWYFQLVDTARSVQMIERCLLNALVSFLNERGVDTSDLVRQQTTILNNGVIVSGNGQINTDNIAVGDNASAGNSLLDNDRESGA